MKGYIFFIIAMLGTLNVARGQHYDIDKGNILTFTVPAQNHFLDEHTEIISFSLRGDTISFVQIVPRQDDTAYLN